MRDCRATRLSAPAVRCGDASRSRLEVFPKRSRAAELTSPICGCDGADRLNWKNFQHPVLEGTLTLLRLIAWAAVGLEVERASTAIAPMRHGLYRDHEKDHYLPAARRFAIASRTLSQPSGCSPKTLSFQSFRQ